MNNKKTNEIGTNTICKKGNFIDWYLLIKKRGTKAPLNIF